LRFHWDTLRACERIIVGYAILKSRKELKLELERFGAEGLNFATIVIRADGKFAAMEWGKSLDSH
jgi:hypothetical protein